MQTKKGQTKFIKDHQPSTFYILIQVSKGNKSINFGFQFEPKPIRPIFITITTTEKKEAYRLLEVCFEDDMFDEVEVVSAFEYVKD